MDSHQPISKLQITLTIIILFLVFTGLRFGWILYFKSSDHQIAEHGVLDLSDTQFTDKKLIPLNGEWEFYPGQFLDPSSDPNNQPAENNFISVPGDWSDDLSNRRVSDNPSYGHGTYRLRVILPDTYVGSYGLRIKSLTTAVHMYLNGETIHKHGDLSTSTGLKQKTHGPFSTFFSTENHELDIVIHLSNYEAPLIGGLTQPIMIGTDQAVLSDGRRSLSLQLTVFILCLLHSLYAISLYIMAKKSDQKELLYYGFMLIIAGFVVLIDDDIVLQLPINAESYFRLLFILFMTTLMALVYAIKHLFNIKSKLFPVLKALYILLCGVAILVPLQYFVHAGLGSLLLFILAIYTLFSNTINIMRRGNREGFYVLIFITSYTSNMIWGALINLSLVNIPFYPFDFIFYVVAIALLLLKRHIDMIRLNEDQTEQLKIADQKKDEFLANTSHELRNPLHGVINIAQTMIHDDRGHLTKDDKENLELLVKVGKHMQFTLNDILDLTHIQDNYLRVNQEHTNVHTIASVVLEMVYFMSDGKDLAYHLNISKDFPNVYADKNRLTQIMFNLIHNAVKYTPEGSITIDAHVEDDFALISIEDTGIGISETSKQKIFNPYEQEDASITSIGGGIGLGLYVSKQLVELQGGTLSVESTRDKGSVFTFTLPLANPSDTNLKENHVRPIQAINTVSLVNREQHRPMKSNHSTKILVVDDDPVNLRILSQMLTTNHHVSTATSGPAALKQLNKGEWDLVISDVMMPHMSGYELTRIIRKQHSLSELPILLLTARHQQKDIQTGFSLGANDYVSKPVDALELTSRVNSLIHLKMSIQEQLRMEAAWLQAQIRPHFLFNTLNSIASLSEIDQIRMIDLLNHFANYLRRSFQMQNTDSLIKLEDELELVHAYTSIEKERFGDRLTIVWRIDEQINIDVPPLSIQPLVENAINHGVLTKVDGGKIILQITEHETCHQISIIDNGVGMAQKKINELLSDLTAPKKGIGVANTNRRLKKLFGEGLSITSELGHGTTVCFRIPKHS